MLGTGFEATVLLPTAVRPGPALGMDPKPSKSRFGGSLLTDLSRFGWRLMELPEVEDAEDTKEVRPVNSAWQPSLGGGSAGVRGAFFSCYSCTLVCSFTTCATISYYFCMQDVGFDCGRGGNGVTVNQTEPVSTTSSLCRPDSPALYPIRKVKGTYPQSQEVNLSRDANSDPDSIRGCPPPEPPASCHTCPSTAATPNQHASPVRPDHELFRVHEGA